MSSEYFLVEAHITASKFRFLSAITEACSWLAQGSQWTDKKSFDVVLAISDFFNSVENATESAPELAKYLGTTVERTQYLFDSMSDRVGQPFPDIVQSIKQVIPLAGHPANNSDLFVAIFVLLSVLMLTFVGLRIYSRLSLGWVSAHDWVLIAASVVTFGFGVMNAACLSGPTHFLGRWDRSWNDYYVNSYSGKATEVLYPLGVFLIKTSLLTFYWSLTTWWPLRAGVVTLFIVSLGNSLAMIFTAVLRCNPVLSFEGYDYFTATCKPELWALGEQVCGSINIGTDILIWLVPLPMVWKITHGTRERIFACLTFGIGALACIACGLRFSHVQEYRQPSIIPRDQSRWLIWAMVEMYLAIICSCVPAIRALVIRSIPTLIGSTANRAGTEYDAKDGQGRNEDKTISDVRIDSSSC